MRHEPTPITYSATARRQAKNLKHYWVRCFRCPVCGQGRVLLANAKGKPSPCIGVRK